MSGRHRAPKVVHRLHGAGRKQGNLGRYLFFEIGKQRDERHLIKYRCRLECATATFCGCGKCGGGLITVFGFCCCLVLMMLARPRESSPLGSVPTCPCPQSAGQPSLNICTSAARFKTCSQNERGNSNCYTTLPPRLQGMGKSRNVTHNPAFTSTKQKSENISRRYTYGMGTPSLGRCPVANKLTV
jgi:hypothetical protein